MITSERSDEIVLTPVPQKMEARQYYLRHYKLSPPPHISYSHFIPSPTVEYLMRCKKDSAVGVKFEVLRSNNSPDRITNIEGALHTFVTPIAWVTMHGDYRWGPGHGVHDFGTQTGQQRGRSVLMSGLIQQDFEDDNVMATVCALDVEESVGVQGLPKFLTTKEKHNDWIRKSYDHHLRLYLIYHLTASHRLPPSKEVREDAMTLSGTLAFLAKAIEVRKAGELPQLMRGSFFYHKGRFLSLEIMFQTAYHQIRNEMLLLEKLCPDQGYVYTFNPPAIFVRFFGDSGTELLSRIHVAALKYFASTTKLEHCRVFAWANFNSHWILPLLKKALEIQPQIIIMSNDQLFSGDKKVGGGLYNPPKEAKGAMLVIHNNSDAFGQNIETEPSGGSLDGVVGAYSSAAASLMRHRKDLCDHLSKVPAP